MNDIRTTTIALKKDNDRFYLDCVNSTEPLHAMGATDIRVYFNENDISEIDDAVSLAKSKMKQYVDGSIDVVFV